MTEKSSIDIIKLEIEDNFREITENIRQAARESGRAPEQIRLMAVTKTVAPVFINHALSLGIDLIGENKVQELLGKMDALQPANVEKHLIGHLQTNKVRKIIDVVTCIESVDSMTLAEEISRQALLHEKTMDILLEVNIGNEVSKTGFPIPELLPAGERIAALPGVRIRGLMAIPPVCETEAEVRGYFAKARELFEALRQATPESACTDTFSIGMSSDYVPAIREGATLVRIGSALFGARRY